MISDAASLMAGGFRAGEIIPDGDEAMLYNDCACPIRHGMHVFRAIVRHHVSILRKEIRMKIRCSHNAIIGAFIALLCLFLSACGKNSFIISGAELFRGKYCTVYSVRDDGSGKEGAEVEINGLEKKELDSDVIETIKKLGEKRAPSVKLGTIEYSLMVETPEGKKRSYGIPVESIEELEELLDTDLMLPDEATGEEKVNYLLIMDPESNKISISSVPLTWKDQSIEFSAWMYNDEAPDFLSVGSMDCAEPACYTETADGEQCDVIPDKERDKAWLILTADHVVYSYKVSFSDEKLIREFLESIE